jgi:hypothetical protein
MAEPRPAPDWQIAHWPNAPSQLAQLRGKVVLAVAFQMWCPGCVSHGHGVGVSMLDGPKIERN